MSQTAARAIAAGAALLALFGCAGPQNGAVKTASQAPVVCTVTADGAPPAQRGLGGTGAKAVADRGFGGTGAPARLLAERGIGGTGGPATGIVGTITGFASVCVNGLEVTYDNDAVVEIDGATRDISALRIGAVASITTDPALAAAQISVRHAVSGPIERVVVPGRIFIVAGQLVELGGQTTQAAMFKAGDWLEVSGLRTHAQTIMASRVDLRPAGDVVITGRFAQANGRAAIAGTPVAGILTPDLNGQVLTVIGPYLNGVLYADAAILAADLATSGEPGLLVVETYAEAKHSQTGTDRLLLSDGTEAAVAADIHSLPQSPTLVVLLLAQSVGGDLTAIGIHDGNVGQGASAAAAAGTSTTATTTTASVAPHSTATTAVGTTAIAASAAAAHASPSTTSKSGAATTSTSKGATSSSGGSKASTGTGSGSSSSGGKGGATGGAATGGTAKGSASAGDAGTSTGGTGTSGGTGSSTKK